MGRRYKNSPIVEALCEFQFEPGLPWDLTIPGLVYEEIRNEFPKKRQAKQVQVELSATADEGITQKVATSDRMQFLREDEKALLQVGPDLLAVNHLKPYPSWQEFVPLIRKGFKAYSEAAGPKAIRRIGLRYINRIEILGESVKVEDYFQFYPFAGPDLPQEFTRFIVGMHIPYESSRDILSLQLASATVETTDTLSAMLDLDYFLTKPGEVTLDKVFEWVEIAHGHVEEVFEACITDRLRQIFEGVTA